MKLRRIVQEAVRIGGRRAGGSANVNAAVSVNVGERPRTRTRSSARQRVVQRTERIEVGETYDARADQ